MAATVSPLLLCSGVRQVERPLVGVMAHVRYTPEGFGGRQGPGLRKYLETARQEGVAACVFDPADVDLKRNRIRGCVLKTRSADGHSVLLEQRDLPLPMVVYDQILSRKYENRVDLGAALEHLRNHCIVFNGGYFDKWQVHEWLSTEPSLRAHLPKTALLRNARTLGDFLDRHEVVFVKPIHGSLGVGIIRARRAPDGWQATLKPKSGPLTDFAAKSAAGLYDQFRWRVAKRRCIVQEGLNLIQWNGRPVDVRAIVQKDKSGAWRRTKLYARVAARGEFVSNLATGGEALPLSIIGEAGRRLNMAAVKREITRLTAEIPAVMERESERLLGELGVDLGVDAAGRVFVIEVNSKPWKTPLTEKGSQKLVDLSFLRPILFARELARNANARREP